MDGFVADYYAKAQLDDPFVPDGHLRVTRGGSIGETALNARSATRLSVVCKNELDYVVFRLAMTIDTKNLLPSTLQLSTAIVPQRSETQRRDYRRERHRPAERAGRLDCT